MANGGTKQTLLLLRGLPGSGKSTYAAELVERGWKRINKDMLRDMIDGGVFSSANEKELNEILYMMADHYLRAGYDVVLDNMHWNPWHFKRAQEVVREVSLYADESDSFVVDVKDFDTHIGECIRRDALRPKPVTEEVIRKIADQWIVDGKWPDIKKYLG